MSPTKRTQILLALMVTYVAVILAVAAGTWHIRGVPIKA
jgi:hypothetical protein